MGMDRSSGHRRPRGIRAAGNIRVIAVLACALLAVLCLGSCRPTDFFTEVIISPFAEEVDEDNEETTVVNSPSADEESDQLSALDWSDESSQSEEVENVVVYSSDPITELAAQHSVFDLYPMIPGIESSDGVKVVFDADAIEDAEADEGVDEPDEAESTTTGGDDVEQDAEEVASSSADSGSDVSSDGGEASGESGEDDPSEGGDQYGDSAGDGGDSSENPGSSEGEGDDGTSDDPDAGYGGEVEVYNAGDAFAEVPRVDSLAVLGTDAAVLVQAIGGEGSICAMSEDAYYGSDDDTTAYSFSEVFNSSGDLGDAAAFESDCLLWDDDGSEPGDLSDIDALVAALEEGALEDGGVIVYDQDLGDQTTFFDDGQRQALYAADVTLVPVDLSSVQGLLDAANVIGDALSESSCANDSTEYADAYCDAMESIVTGVADLHGGTYAATSKDGDSEPLSDFNSCPISSSVVGGLGYPVRSCIAVDAATGWSWLGSADIDVSGILLFGSSDYDSSPLAFWGQVAGVAPHTATQDGSLDLFWPYRSNTPVDFLSGSGSTYDDWLGTDSSWSPMQAGPSSTNEGAMISETYGLGSCYVPYLVVSATSELTAEEVRELTVESLRSYGTSSITTSYSAFPYGTGTSGDEGVGTVPMNSSGLRSTIGAMNADSSYSESPFYTSLDVEDVVRANPCGLLGSWTEGSMECVLEAIWLGELYSKSPDGCPFEPFNDFSELSVTIGGEECTTTEEAVEAFYSYFYRVGSANLDACYDAAVPDQLDDF